MRRLISDSGFQEYDQYVKSITIFGKSFYDLCFRTIAFQHLIMNSSKIRNIKLISIVNKLKNNKSINQSLFKYIFYFSNKLLR